jgi:hypothetical protein
LPRSSAVFAAVLATTKTPCRGGYVSGESDRRCYKLGSVLLRPSDVAEKAALVDLNDPPGWMIIVDLTPAATKRLRQYAVAHPEQRLAIVAGDRVVLASNIPDLPSHAFAIDDDFTEAQAKRISNALGGRDTSDTSITVPVPTAPTSG